MTELSRSTDRRGRDIDGTVTAFDEAVGLGTIEAASGSEHLFHCIEIADGSRSIEVGAAVTFDLLAKFGSYEAANIRV